MAGELWRREGNACAKGRTAEKKEEILEKGLTFGRKYGIIYKSPRESADESTLKSEKELRKTGKAEESLNGKRKHCEGKWNEAVKKSVK